MEGPITSKVQVDASNGTLTVLGQTVLVDETTKFDDDITLKSLAVGDVVEVSGFVKDGANGVIVASFIEKKAGAGCTAGCEIKGVVKGHNHSLTTFQIGGLTVVYNKRTDIGNMPIPNGSNWNNIFVEVKGTTLTGPTLTATKIEPEDDDVANSVDEFEVEGFVTEVGGLGDFFIGTTHVQTTANTEFRGGTVDEIIVGVKLSVEGRLANGILTAKEVKFEDGVKLEGNIAVINLNAKTFTITGLTGVTISVNSQTEFKANGGNNIIGLDDLSLNDHVRVRGRVGSNNSIIATRVDKRSASGDVDLQGPVQAVSNPNLTIFGVTVDTLGISDNEFKGLNDGAIGRAAFFNAVKVGTLVKVKGWLNDAVAVAVVTWREVEVEDEE